MLIEIILFLILGVISGIFTGLIPGIHINLIGVFLLSLSSLYFFNPLFFVVFIVSMAITHTFLDFIPSIFLGCPDTDTELSVLPGHKLLKKGRGYEAIILTSYGSIMAILTLIIISFPSIFLIEKIYSLLQKPYLMGFILLIVSFLLISGERKKVHAFFVFLLTGFLGLSVLNLPSLKQPLLPLLTGLFGSSMMIMSIKNKIHIPLQKIKKPKTKILKPLAGAFIGSLIASPLCSFLPGLGSGQAAIIGNRISKTNKKGFLILVGATNTLVMGFSFLSLYTITKTRTGAAAVINEIIGIFSWKILILILFVVLISGIISFFLTDLLAKIFSKNIAKLNYTLISIITLSVLIIIVSIVSGFLGLIVLTASTLTGI